MKKAASILLFTLSQACLCFGQDLIRYCRINSPYSSECYSFYKENVTATGGTFKVEIDDDSGRCAKGTGSFTETTGKILLSSFTLSSSACGLNESGKPFNNIPATTLLVPSQILLKRRHKLLSLPDKQDKLAGYEQKIIFARSSSR